MRASATNYCRPQRICGKVMFSQACVKNSVQGGVSQHALGQTPCWDTPPWADTPRADTPLGHTPLGRHPSLGRHTPATPSGQIPLLGTPPSADTPPWADTPPSHCSRWYASYWNAFLLHLVVINMTQFFSA